MQDKRLVNVGHSLAVIIEKPILRMMGIGTASLLRMWTDGHRIIIEPTGQRVSANRRAGALRRDEVQEPPPAHDVMELVEDDAVKENIDGVLDELCRFWDFSPDEFFALHHEEEPLATRNTNSGLRFRYIMRFAAWCMSNAATANATELGTMKRLQRFHERLRQGVNRSAALEDALRAFPR